MASNQVSFPDVPVSRFDPFQDNKGVWKPGLFPQPDLLFRQLQNFQQGYYANLIATLRSLEDKKQRDQYKTRNLPAFTLSAVIEGKRATENVKNHTGFLVIDLDNEGILPFIKKRQLDDPSYTIASLRDELARVNAAGVTNVLFAALSASGTGLFLVIAINPVEHLECFKALEWELDNVWGIKVDPSGKDIVRLRFCTYDPDAILRDPETVEKYTPSDEYYEWIRIQRDRQAMLKKQSRTFTSNSDAATRIVQVAIGMIDKAQQGNRHQSVLNAARLMGGYVASGVFDLNYASEVLTSAVESRTDSMDEKQDRMEAIRWGLEQGQLNPIALHIISPSDPNFQHFTEQNEQKQDLFKQFYSEILKLNRDGLPFNQLPLDDMCRNYSVDLDRGEAIATRLYRENSDEHNFAKLSPPHKLDVFLRKRWEIRKNTITGDMFLRVRGSGNEWKKLLNEELWIACHRQFMPAKIDDINHILKTDLVEQYNPFLYYFQSLKGKYDRASDPIAALAAHIEVRNTSHDFFETMLKKMLVRAIKCAVEDNYVNRFVFVLQDFAQNTGKTWLFRWLNPWGMEHYYAETPLGDTKDDRIRMSEVFVYNLEELSTVTKKDVNALKAVISGGHVKERRPWDRYSTTMPRRCSFFGSTNRAEFLTDDTNTRWLIFEIVSIDWSYRENINLNQLWAQAYHLYITGYDCELTKEEASMRDDKNDRYGEITSEDTLLQRYFRSVDQDTTACKWMTANDIANRLQILNGNPRYAYNLNSLNRAFRKQKFKYHYHKAFKVFPVMPINQAALDCSDVRELTDQPTDISSGIPPEMNQPPPF